jgi:phage tail sheath protein FI
MQTPASSLPGVYWQDVFPPEPILPLTGVPAFLGISPVKDGVPQYTINQPQEVRLWTQFVEQFKAETSGSYMADVVRGFFENGGRDCVIVWIKDASEQSLAEGLTASAVMDRADLICAPDLASLPELVRRERQAQLLRHCAEMGDRFVILDTPHSDSADLNLLKASATALKNLPGCDYAALYGPWLRVPNNPKAIPPCGHVAGVYAACDRASIPRAPANIALEGVLDVAALFPVQQTELAQISDAPINGIRSLRGRGVRIWGARTLSSDPDWRYINVRRLAITIRRWIALNLAEIAFEPNDFRLWVRIERELNAYLQSLWQRGLLQGITANEAFRVHCNGELNPPEVRDRGQVITQIEFAPTIPNEFIQLRLIHGETGVVIATP